MAAAPTSAAMAPPVLRNLITTLFTFSHKSTPLRLLCNLLTSFILFFLSPTPPKPNTLSTTTITNNNNNDSGLSRALAQLLAIVNDIPVSSRKYEIVRLLAETIVDDNNREGLHSLNRRALTTSFAQTLRRLENAAVAEERGDFLLPADFYYLGTALKALRYVGDVAWARVLKLKPVVVETEEVQSGVGGGLGEKLAAEVLWLAMKLAECGYVEEAMEQWASASSLAWISLRVEPRLQGSMVKVSSYLFKKAGEIGRSGEGLNEGVMMKILVSWLPLLCRASNGVVAPVLSGMEKAELERILEEMIDGLESMDDQEKVLALWLHHFTYCPSSDWPNLNKCYANWCNESRKQLLLY